jgi:hypothetical protein
MNKKQIKQQQIKQKALEDKKFNRISLFSFISLIIVVVSILTFYTYGCETKFSYRQWAWYGKKIPSEWVCMNGNNLQLHKSSQIEYKQDIYYFCSQNCFNHLVNHYSKVSTIQDAFSGDTILKADAIIGLKEKGQPFIVYFENKQTFKKYYEQNR